MDNKLTIIIDIREDTLYNDIFDRDLDIYKDKIEIIKESLDIGDIHIKYNDILYIFERKTVRDLVSSIHDGRYREQKARMLSIYDKYQLSYIIEEDDVISSKIYSNKSFQTLRGGRKKIPFFLILFSTLPPFDCQQQSSFLSSSSCFVTIAIL